MVEIHRNFMLSPSSFGTTARTQSAQSHYGVSCILLPLAASSAFSFGSCKEGWYYRCLGVDPWAFFSLLLPSVLDFFVRFFAFFFLIPFHPPRLSLSQSFVAIIGTTMLLYKQKKNQSAGKANRLLISINVLGSAGPIRFVVSEDELVAAVIDTALKSYAREGRLPILGSDLNNFLLYCSNAGSDGNLKSIN